MADCISSPGAGFALTDVIPTVGGALNATSVAVSNVAWQDVSSAATYCSASEALAVGNAAGSAG